MNGSYRVIFIQHKITLDLGRTDLSCSLKDMLIATLNKENPEQK